MITEQIFYGVKCDRCGEDFESRGDYSFMVDQGDILDEAYEQDWQNIDGRHYCPNCYEDNPDPDHDDDHEYRPKPAFPEYVDRLKRFVAAILGGWRQEEFEDQLLIRFHTGHNEKELAPEYEEMIRKILKEAEYRIEVLTKENTSNATVIVYITLKRFFKGDRVKVARHGEYHDYFGKEGVIIEEAPAIYKKGCYGVQLKDESELRFFRADSLQKCQ